MHNRHVYKSKRDGMCQIVANSYFPSVVPGQGSLRKQGDHTTREAKTPAADAHLRPAPWEEDGVEEEEGEVEEEGKSGGGGRGAGA